MKKITTKNNQTERLHNSVNFYMVRVAIWKEALRLQIGFYYLS